jgi:hypothetical protein
MQMSRRSATRNSDDDPTSQAAHTKQGNLQRARLVRGAGSIQEDLRSRGRSRLKGLKTGTWQDERNCRASVRCVHRHQNALKPLPDNSSLRQIVADWTIRPVVAALNVGGCYGRRVLETNFTIFASALALLSGMVNAEDVVQTAPKQRRYA